MKSNELKDAIIRAKRGEQEALIHIYSETNSMVYFTALKLLGNETDAMDIVQETYIKVFQSIETLREVDAFPKWIKTIAVNLCRNQLIKKKPMLFESEQMHQKVIEEIPEVGEAFLPEEYALKKEKSRLIMEIIDKLPEQQKSAVIMYYFDELSVGEIANVMETNDGTIKSRLNYARKMIKEEVEKLEKKGTKLYSAPVLPILTRIILNASQDYTLPESSEKLILSKVLADGINQAGAGSPSSSAVPDAYAKTGHGIIGKFSALEMNQKIIAVVIAILLTAGAATTVYFVSENDKVLLQNGSTSQSLTQSPVQGVDLETSGAYLILTVRQPEDMSHVTGYMVNLIDSAHPENNLRRHCKLDGKAYISFEAEGNYNRISVTTLLENDRPAGVWEDDIDINCTVASMPTYTAEFSTVENMVITDFISIEAEFLQFDICKQDGANYTTLDDDGYNRPEKDTGIGFLGSDKWDESFKQQLSSGSLYLRLRGWTYQTPTRNSEGVNHMDVTYYDFGPYVSITAGDRKIEWKK